MHYDLVIIGAGLAGSSLAAALLQEKGHFKIAIVDKGLAPANSVNSDDFNSRAIALSWSSIQLLKKIGVWSFLLQEQERDASLIEEIREVQVSEQGHFALSSIAAQNFDLPFLGAVVNADFLNTCLTRFIYKAAAAVSESTEIHQKEDSLRTAGGVRIDFFRKTEIEKLKRENGIWTLELSNGQMMHASFLVGADGSDSFLRRQQGVGLQLDSQSQTAIVVNVGLKQDHRGVAYERFLKSGSIAMLPFGTKRVKCVWIVSNAEAKGLSEKTDQAFLQAVQSTFGFRLGILSELGKRFSYAIQSSHADNFYGQGWVLIGNAANTVSPVAAQGFNLGLRDACILAEEFVNAKKNARGFEIDFLKAYAERRFADHARMRQFVQQLELGGLKRRLGILVTEFMEPVKDYVGRLGMGLQNT